MKYTVYVILLSLLLGGCATSSNPGSSPAAKVWDLGELSRAGQLPRPVSQVEPVLTPNATDVYRPVVPVAFVVQEDGSVADAVAQDGSTDSYAQAAVAAVRQWKFSPGKVGNTPVKVRMLVPIRFEKKD